MNAVRFFEIQSDDPTKAIEFYKAVFGWEFTEQPGPIEYWQIKTDGINGGLLKRPAPAPPAQQSGTNAFTCSVQVENFDTVAADILKHGGKVALDKFAVPGKCWQGYFLDLDGNTFGLFQADENAA